MIENKNFNYKFDESKCKTCAGNCCIGESGYIWITIDEIEKLALHLKLSIKEVFDQYITKYGYKFSIRENKLSENNYACTFFDLEKKQCGIYEARPTQCKSFPFWDYFKSNIEELKNECPGIV